MKIAHYQGSRVNDTIPQEYPFKLEAQQDLSSGQQYFPTSPNDRPYDWECEEDWSHNEPEHRKKVVISSTPQPMQERHDTPITTTTQRCIAILKYTGALAGEFISVMKQTYFPPDQLTEIRKRSKEDGESTIVHIKW